LFCYYYYYYYIVFVSIIIIINNIIITVFFFLQWYQQHFIFRHFHFDSQVVYQLENAALDTSDEGIPNASPVPENSADFATSIGELSQPHLSVADPAEETAQEQQEGRKGSADSLDNQMLEKGDKNDDQPNREIEMSSLEVRIYYKH